MSRLIVRYLIAKFPKGSGDIFRFIDESQFLFGKFKLIHLFYSRHSWEYLRQKTSVAKKTRIFSCSFCFITSQNQNLFSLLNIFSSSSFLLGYYVFNSFFARLFLKMLYGHIEYATTPRADEQVSFTRLVTLLSDWHLAVGSNKWFSIKFYEYVMVFCLPEKLTIGNWKFIGKSFSNFISPKKHHISPKKHHISH